MPHLKAAHINEQGQNMIIFPLDHTFGQKTDTDQSRSLMELERRAHSAGLAGRAVAVWQSGGRTLFRGPQAWRGFLQSISMDWVHANVNKQISW